jgi:predicted nucleic acid-binding protein
LIAAIDTNILAYAVGMNDEERRASAVQLLRRIPAESIVLPAQVMGELFGVLVRKGGVRPGTAGHVLEQFLEDYFVASTTPTVIAAALRLTVMSKVSIWDSIVLATAAETGCDLLLSEDMDHGFIWSGVTVVNPFKTPRHQLLDDLIADASS